MPREYNTEELEEFFEPEDCTMVMEDYGKCQDYPCDDCLKRFKSNLIAQKMWEDINRRNEW